MSEIRFDDRVAVITGAGGGLGRTYALEFARRGAKVVVNDLGGAADGSGAGTSMADQVVKEITEAGGTAVSNFVKLTPEELEIVLDVHLKGAFFVSQPAFRSMKERNYGRFVHTASAAGIFGNFGQTNYGAAKMGLVGLSNVMAVEGAKNNIKSNVIAPIARTRLTEDLLGPMAEHVKPECVTPLTVYLCSEDCDVTHSIYSVGGGRFARIFIGMGQGWIKGVGAEASVEEIAANWDAIHSDANYVIPDSIADEMKALLEAFKG